MGKLIDETGNKYGRLLVIDKVKIKGHWKWHCRCDCGNEIDVSGTMLRSGNTKSCGCLQSKGEAKIQQLLDILNIKYERQKVFNECRGKTGRQPLFFDFYLPKYNMCLEYQGEQHYRPVDFFGGEDAFNNLQLNDSEKEKFCKENNITLIKIKYNQYNDLNIDYLKEVVLSGHLYS